MDATSIPEPPGYSELSPTEQVRYIQMLWDRLFEKSDELPVPEGHLEIVEERLSDYRRGASQVRSAFAIFEELANRESK